MTPGEYERWLALQGERERLVDQRETIALRITEIDGIMLDMELADAAAEYAKEAAE